MLVCWLVLFLLSEHSEANQFTDFLDRMQSILGFDSNLQTPTQFDEEYDFVVIGAGTGGSVVANRLSENPKWSILLLEAGRDDSFLADIPLIASIQTSTSFNWGYKTEKSEKACLGLIDQRCNLPRGKVLGGTSAINFLIYTRGSPHDYDEWAAAGNYGWSYKDVLPYFIKSENCSFCEDVDWEYHGKNGYVPVENSKYYTPIRDLFLKASKNLGYRNVDINGKSVLGFSQVQATMHNGIRYSAAKAFLKSIPERNNLDISLQSRVTKILIDPQLKKIIGVEFLRNRKLYRIKARKEVILSAGSFNSPQLLMLSGIGPSDLLKRHDIPVLQNLKVGYNLQDHLAISTLAFLINETVSVSDTNLRNSVYFFNYLLRGEGPFSMPAGSEALAFVKTKYAKKEQNWPDIELVLGAGGLNGDTHGSLRRLAGIPDSFYDKVYGSISHKPAFSITPVLMRPKSRGRVLLKDANPLHWPVIEANYLDDPQDVAVLVEGMKLAIAVASTDHFKRYATKLHNVSYPGCEDENLGTDAFWACAVRHVATTLGHQVGTCKMGPATDPDAVVDPELRVYGIEGLRVVDGSVMPNIVTGHTNAVVMMIGEKAGDLIKRTWNE